MPTQVPIDSIPLDLRFPNREFIIVFSPDWKVERVERFAPGDIPEIRSQEWYYPDT